MTYAHFFNIADTCAFDLVNTVDNRMEFAQKPTQKQLKQKPGLFLSCFWVFKAVFVLFKLLYIVHKIKDTGVAKIAGTSVGNNKQVGVICQKK